MAHKDLGFSPYVNAFFLKLSILMQIPNLAHQQGTGLFLKFQANLRLLLSKQIGIRGHSLSTYAPKWQKFDPSPMVRTCTLAMTPPLCTYRTYNSIEKKTVKHLRDVKKSQDMFYRTVMTQGRF